MPSLPAYPLINGNRFDYSSIEIVIAGVPFRGVQSISYSDSLSPQKVRGTSAMPLGRARGPYEADDASMDMYREDFDVFTSLLLPLGAGGYGEANFQTIVTYQELVAAQLQVDELVGCRVKKVEDSHKDGDAGLIVKVTIDLMLILRNGKPLANPATQLK